MLLLLSLVQFFYAKHTNKTHLCEVGSALSDVLRWFLFSSRLQMCYLHTNSFPNLYLTNNHLPNPELCSQDWNWASLAPLRSIQSTPKCGFTCRHTHPNPLREKLSVHVFHVTLPNKMFPPALALYRHCFHCSLVDICDPSVRAIAFQGAGGGV